MAGAKSTKGTRFVAFYPQPGLSPKVEEQQFQPPNEKHVWYGKNNLFPEYIRTRADNCGPLERCMSMLAQFIAGEGIKFYTKAGEEVKEAQAAFQSLLRNTTEEEFLWRTGYDLAHGLGLAWIPRRSASGDIVRLDHLDVVGYRSGPMEDDTDADGLPTKRVKTAYWSSDWAAHQANKTDDRFKPVMMPVFQFGENAKMYPASVLYDKIYKPRQPYYSVPWFLPAMPACETWEQVDEYNRTQLATGFTPAIVAGFRMEGTESDMDRQLEKLEQAYQGAQGSAMFPFPMGPGEQEPFFKELKRGNHAGELDEMRTGASDVICDVYGVPTILFRDRSEGLTSQADSVGQRLQQFERTLVRPMQKLITRNLVKLLNIPEVWEAKIEPLQIFDPVQSEAVMLASTTVDEARDQAGKDAHEDPKVGAMLLAQAQKLPSDPEMAAQLAMEKAKAPVVAPGKPPAK